MTLRDLLLLVFAGLLAGSINGVVGGGTLLSFPILLALGVPPVSASATNTVALVPGYVGGALIHRRELATQDSGAVRLLAGIAGAGALGGAVALVAFPDQVFTAVVPWLIAAATILFAVQPWIARRVSHPEGDSRPSPVLLLSIAFAGAYGAYFGGALGVLLLAILGVGMAGSLRRLNAVRAIVSVATNVVALLILVVIAPISWSAVAVFAPTSFVGGMFGARIARRIPQPLLRALVMLIGFTTAIILFLR